MFRPLQMLCPFSFEFCLSCFDRFTNYQWRKIDVWNNACVRAVWVNEHTSLFRIRSLQRIRLWMLMCRSCINRLSTRSGHRRANFIYVFRCEKRRRIAHGYVRYVTDFPFVTIACASFLFAIQKWFIPLEHSNNNNIDDCILYPSNNLVPFDIWSHIIDWHASHCKQFIKYE